ncbi:hypothetical protein BLNAU_15790 [Blattamonas nauphoetae]|uniref:Uncharacterized protein n=1 Tax=Blattamonas nauphoetae TaxID=2049346 RepID=A0ABQ9XCA8_9EUKA|nr:hypothetical protein BLNAU_15790 [Blattamonas nauphoetae]
MPQNRSILISLHTNVKEANENLQTVLESPIFPSYILLNFETILQKISQDTNDQFSSLADQCLAHFDSLSATEEKTIAQILARELDDVFLSQQRQPDDQLPKTDKKNAKDNKTKETKATKPTSSEKTKKGKKGKETLEIDEGSEIEPPMIDEIDVNLLSPAQLFQVNEGSLEDLSTFNPPHKTFTDLLSHSRYAETADTTFIILLNFPFSERILIELSILSTEFPRPIQESLENEVPEDNKPEKGQKKGTKKEATKKKDAKEQQPTQSEDEQPAVPSIILPSNEEPPKRQKKARSYLPDVFLNLVFEDVLKQEPLYTTSSIPHQTFSVDTDGILLESDPTSHPLPSSLRFLVGLQRGFSQTVPLKTLKRHRPVLPQLLSSFEKENEQDVEEKKEEPLEEKKPEKKKAAPKKASRQGKRKGKGEEKEEEEKTEEVAELSEETLKQQALEKERKELEKTLRHNKQTDLQQLGELFDRLPPHPIITPGELTAKEAIVIGGGDEAQAKSESDDDDALRETSEDDSDEGKEASEKEHPPTPDPTQPSPSPPPEPEKPQKETKGKKKDKTLADTATSVPASSALPTARDALETNPESLPTQPKEDSDDENNRFNKQQKEGRRGRRRAERLRRKGRLNDLKQKTENSDTLEMLTEILMAPTVQTVAIKKQRDLSLVAARTIQKCFDGLLLKAIVDSELEKRGREASPELDTTSNTPNDMPPRSSPNSSPPESHPPTERVDGIEFKPHPPTTLEEKTPKPRRRARQLTKPTKAGLKSLYAKQIEPASDPYLPLLPLVRSVFAIEDSLGSDQKAVEMERRAREKRKAELVDDEMRWYEKAMKKREEEIRQRKLDELLRAEEEDESGESESKNTSDSTPKQTDDPPQQDQRESDEDDEAKEPNPIVLEDIELPEEVQDANDIDSSKLDNVIEDLVSNILHVRTAHLDQTALQRQKRKRERRLRNELHSIFKEEEELSTSEEERRRLAALKKDDDGLLNYNLPSEHPSHRPTPVPSPLNLRVMELDAVSVHPSNHLALSEYLLNQLNAFKPQFAVDRLLSELRHASHSTSAFFFSRVGPLFTRFFPKHRLTLSQQIQRDRIKSEKPNRRGPHNAKTIVKRSAEETESMWTMLRHFTKMIKKEDIQLLIWVVILHWLVFPRNYHKEEFTGRDNKRASTMTDGSEDHISSFPGLIEQAKDKPTKSSVLLREYDWTEEYDKDALMSLLPRLISNSELVQVGKCDADNTVLCALGLVPQAETVYRSRSEYSVDPKVLERKRKAPKIITVDQIDSAVASISQKLDEEAKEKALAESSAPAENPDVEAETAPSEDEKPKSKASAKRSKSPAKEKKGKKGKEEKPSKDAKPAEEPHETEESTAHQGVLQTFMNDLVDTVVQRCSADAPLPPQEHSRPHVKPAKAVLDETVSTVFPADHSKIVMKTLNNQSSLLVHHSNHSAVFGLTTVKPFALNSIINPQFNHSLPYPPLTQSPSDFYPPPIPISLPLPHTVPSTPSPFRGIPRVFVSLPFVDAFGRIIFDVDRRKDIIVSQDTKPKKQTQPPNRISFGMDVQSKPEALHQSSGDRSEVASHIESEYEQSLALSQAQVRDDGLNKSSRQKNKKTFATETPSFAELRLPPVEIQDRFVCSWNNTVTHSRNQLGNDNVLVCTGRDVTFTHALSQLSITIDLETGAVMQRKLNENVVKQGVVITDVSNEPDKVELNETEKKTEGEVQNALPSFSMKKTKNPTQIETEGVHRITFGVDGTTITKSMTQREQNSGKKAGVITEGSIMFANGDYSTFHKRDTKRRRRRRNYQSEEQPQPATDKAPKKRKLDVFDLIFDKVRKQKGMEADSETDDEMTVYGIDGAISSHQITDTCLAKRKQFRKRRRKPAVIDPSEAVSEGEGEGLEKSTGRPTSKSGTKKAGKGKKGKKAATEEVVEVQQTEKTEQPEEEEEDEMVLENMVHEWIADSIQQNLRKPNTNVDEGVADVDVSFDFQSNVWVSQHESGTVVIEKINDGFSQIQAVPDTDISTPQNLLEHLPTDYRVSLFPDGTRISTIPFHQPHLKAHPFDLTASAMPPFISGEHHEKCTSLNNDGEHLQSGREKRGRLKQHTQLFVGKDLIEHQHPVPPLEQNEEELLKPEWLCDNDRNLNEPFGVETVVECEGYARIETESVVVMKESTDHIRMEITNPPSTRPLTREDANAISPSTRTESASEQGESRAPSPVNNEPEEPETRIEYAIRPSRVKCVQQMNVKVVVVDGTEIEWRFDVDGPFVRIRCPDGNIIESGVNYVLFDTTMSVNLNKSIDKEEDKRLWWNERQPDHPLEDETEPDSLPEPDHRGQNQRTKQTSKLAKPPSSNSSTVGTPLSSKTKRSRKEGSVNQPHQLETVTSISAGFDVPFESLSLKEGLERTPAQSVHSMGPSPKGLSVTPSVRSVTSSRMWGEKSKQTSLKDLHSPAQSKMQMKPSSPPATAKKRKDPLQLRRLSHLHNGAYLFILGTIPKHVGTAVALSLSTPPEIVPLLPSLSKEDNCPNSVPNQTDDQSTVRTSQVVVPAEADQFVKLFQSYEQVYTTPSGFAFTPSFPPVSSLLSAPVFSLPPSTLLFSDWEPRTFVLSVSPSLHTDAVLHGPLKSDTLDHPHTVLSGRQIFESYSAQFFPPPLDLSTIMSSVSPFYTNIHSTSLSLIQKNAHNTLCVCSLLPQPPVPPKQPQQQQPPPQPSSLLTVHPPLHIDGPQQPFSTRSLRTSARHQHNASMTAEEKPQPLNEKQDTSERKPIYESLDVIEEYGDDDIVKFKDLAVITIPTCKVRICKQTYLFDEKPSSPDPTAEKGSDDAEGQKAREELRQFEEELRNEEAILQKMGLPPDEIAAELAEKRAEKEREQEAERKRAASDAQADPQSKPKFNIWDLIQQPPPASFSRTTELEDSFDEFDLQEPLNRDEKAYLYPRLFVIQKDGSGIELLRESDKTMDLFTYRNHGALNVVEAKPDQKSSNPYQPLILINEQYRHIGNVFSAQSKEDSQAAMSDTTGSGQTSLQAMIQSNPFACSVTISQHYPAFLTNTHLPYSFFSPRIDSFVPRAIQDRFVTQQHSQQKLLRRKQLFIGVRKLTSHPFISNSSFKVLSRALTDFQVWLQNKRQYDSVVMGKDMRTADQLKVSLAVNQRLQQIQRQYIQQKKHDTARKAMSISSSQTMDTDDGFIQTDRSEYDLPSSQKGRENVPDLKGDLVHMTDERDLGQRRNDSERVQDRLDDQYDEDKQLRTEAGLPNKSRRLSRTSATHMAVPEANRQKKIEKMERDATIQNYSVTGLHPAALTPQRHMTLGKRESAFLNQRTMKMKDTMKADQTLSARDATLPPVIRPPSPGTQQKTSTQRRDASPKSNKGNSTTQPLYTPTRRSRFPITASPAEVDFGTVEATDKASISARVLLTNVGADGVTFSAKVESEEKFITITLPKNKLQSGTAGYLHIDFSPQFTFSSEKTINSAVIVTIDNHPSQLRIPLSATIVVDDE